MSDNKGVNMETTTKTKPWWKSRILWLNFIAASLAALDAMSSVVRETIAGYGFDNAGPTLIIIVSILNVFFRLITTTTIGKTK
jgi:hypothetical protein